MPNETGLLMTWTTKGKSTGTLAAKIGNEKIHMDTGDITKADFRRKFAAAVCKGRPAVNQADVETEILRLADDAVKKAQDQNKAIVDGADLHIVRPERFIHPAVSGLTVADRAIVDGKPMGKWMLFLRWSDGRRERMDLPTCLDLPEDRRLWIHPEPYEPLPTTAPGWSRAGRQAWLDGADAPNGADLFRRVCERIAYFLDLPADKAPGITATLALWTMLTYIYLAFDAVPYLYIGGPLGSGKSRVFEILARLVFRPLCSSSLTAACLFRTLHNQGGVLLLDEAERLRESTPDMGEINSMLLAGYKHGGKATRLESVGDSFKTVEFEVYGPKAVACIAGLPAALASRCIPLTMFRAAPGSVKPRRRIDADPQSWIDLRDDLHVLALEHGQTWIDLAHRSDVCPDMSGRHYELWQPPLALAGWIEAAGATGLTEIVKAHALDTIEAGRDDQLPDADETLLRIVAEKFQAGLTFTSGDLLSAAQQSDPLPFQRWTPRTISNRLRQYGIPAPRKSTHGRRVFDKISLTMLTRIQQNYGIDLDISPLPPPKPTTATPNVLPINVLPLGGEGGERGEAQEVTP